MKIKYYCIVISICSLVYKDTIAQSYRDLSSFYKIVFTKYNVPSDYFDGSDVFLFNPYDTITCLSDFSKKSKMPKISSNGLYVVYTSGQNSLIITNFSNSQKDTLHLDIGKYIWHADGKQIIYQDNTGIKTFNIMTKKTRIIYNNGAILPFCISPDGKTILCQQMQQIDGKYLYQMILVSETTDVKTLDGPGAEKRFGSFSYDGNYIVYTGGNKDLMDNLYSYNLFTNTYQQLTESNGEDLEAVYSPDGQYICFVSTRLQDSRGNYKLYIMNSDGSNQKMIYEEFASNIRWPKNSEYIYFLGLDGIYRIKSDGSGLLKIVDEGNTSYISDFDIAYLEDVSSIKDIEDLPHDFELFQNYPNPFNPQTTINYSLVKQSYVTVKIYDVLGIEIKTLVNKVKPAGNYSIDFYANNLASGIYFYQLKTDEFNQTKKMLLLR